MDTLSVTRDTPATPDVRAMLLHHFDLMRAAAPAESCHVLRPDDLLGAQAALFAARSGQQLLGIGALVALDKTHGELKSMHTSADARGRGVGRAIVSAILDHARRAGMTRVSLEAGSDAAAQPARALYAATGFAPCPPFGAYADDPLSIFMTRPL